MRVSSFFAGIGGFDLAFENVGLDIVFQCEIDSFCRKILHQHWPEVTVFEDITKLDEKSIPDSNIWCGGFPCQDVSLARGAHGREGLKGKQSGLFYNFLELIKARLPQVILLENVTGLLSSHKGADFNVIISSLTSLGYGVSWRVLNTRYFGAPQSRPRVYICAWKGNLTNAVAALHEFGESPKPANPRLDFIEFECQKGINARVPKIGYCLAATSGRHTGTDWSRTYISYFDQVRRLTPTEAERLQGFPTNWTFPKTPNAKSSEIDSLRYHAAGNAVSVPVVEWIGNRIRRLLNNNNQDESIGVIKANYSDFSGTSKKVNHYVPSNPLDLTDVQEEFKWCTGGFAIDGEIVQSTVHSSPINAINSKLVEILDSGEVDNKYFLSPGAARGILRRVKSQNRKLFQPLYEALNRLAGSTQMITENKHEILFD